MLDLRQLARNALGVQQPPQSDVQEALDLSPVVPVAQFGNRAQSTDARRRRFCGAWAFLTTAGASYYLAPGGSTPGNATPGSTEAAARCVQPVAGTLKGFYVRPSGALTAANSLTITVRKNGIATALTVLLDSTSVSGTVQSLVQDVAFAANDELSIEVVAVGGSGSNKLFSYTLEYVI